MNDTRPHVDPVNSEPQRTAPGPLPPGFLPTPVRYEIGADQGIVLASEKARTELSVRRRFGASDRRLMAGRHSDAATPSASGKQKP